MSKFTPKNNDNEEIDLGFLFNSIGRAFTKLFSFIGNIVMFLLNTIFDILVFVRKRIVYFALACVVGLAAGIVIENTSPTNYLATATLEPHFDSARQLYSNVDYVNDLAKQSDSIQLGTFFGISTADAATISTLEIAPFVTETRLLQEYHDFLIGLV